MFQVLPTKTEGIALGNGEIWKVERIKTPNRRGFGDLQKVEAQIYPHSVADSAGMKGYELNIFQSASWMTINSATTHGNKQRALI
jgi:hypothetical protein